MSQQHTVIIGGGVIGAFCAYFLRHDGHDVTIVDAGAFGKACSHGNSGYVSPSHVLPLTIPGVVRKMGLKAFSKRSPLYIRPRLSPSLWRWMLRFARNCNDAQMMRAARAIAPLLDVSRELYSQVIDREQLACEWQPAGIAFVYQTKHHFDDFEPTAALMEREFGRHFDRWDESTLLAKEPALKPGSAAGAWYYAGDAHLRPDRLMSEMKRMLLAKGVKILENTPVSRIICEASRAKSVSTPQGDIDATNIIVATGAYTPQLASLVGAKVPIQPGKGYSITMARPAICPTRPLIFEEHRVAITPMQTGYRIGSTMEFSGYDTTLNPARLEGLVRGATHYLKEPTAEPVVERWFGFRPMTPDSVPIIDRAPIAENVWVAAGHNMLGLSMAPATGQLVADLVGGRKPSGEPAAYRLGRF